MNVKQLIDKLEVMNPASDVTIGNYERNMGVTMVSTWNEVIETNGDDPKNKIETDVALLIWDDSFCAGCDDEPYDEENNGPDMGPDHRPYGEYLTVEMTLNRLKQLNPDMELYHAGLGGYSVELFANTVGEFDGWVTQINDQRVGVE